MFRILSIVLLSFLIPNISYAYVDPNIFTILWQSIAAFLFAILAYSKFLFSYFKMYLKSLRKYFLKFEKFFLFELLIIILVVSLPIQIVVSKENNFFYHQDFLNTIFIQVLILFFIFLILKFYFKNLKKTILFSCFIFLIIQFYGFLEGYLITKFVTAFNLKYFRITSLIIFLLTNLYLIYHIKSVKIDSFKNFFFIFVFALNFILLVKFTLNHDKIFHKKELWSYDKPEIGLINDKQNINLIITDSYITNEYYKKLYGSDNKFYEFLRKNNYHVIKNNLSNYSNTYLSVPSILNSNYFENINKELIKNTTNLIDNSYLIENLRLNGYSNNYYKCKLDYLTKNRSCKKFLKYNKLRNDLNMLETIYYYNSIYSAIRYIKNYVIINTDLNIFKGNKNTINKDIENIFKINSQNILNIIILTIPHPPYVVKKNCEWRKNLSRQDLTLNSYFIKNHDKRMEGYKENLFCANKYLTQFIEQIQKHDDQSLTIILSDNGPMLRPKKLFLENKIRLSEKDKYALDRNSSILAINGNFKCKNELDKFNHINLFRIIFNCNSKIKNELLPEKIFLTEPNSLLNYKLYSRNE